MRTEAKESMTLEFKASLAAGSGALASLTGNTPARRRVSQVDDDENGEDNTPGGSHPSQKRARIASTSTQPILSLSPPASV